MIPLDSRGIAESLRGEIDTRIWIAYGRVDSAFVRESRQTVVVTAFTPEEVPDIVCRWGLLYAGIGFGFCFPLPKIGDEVIVFFPGGNPEMGPVAMPRLNNVRSQVPDDFSMNPRQVLLKTESGIPVNIQAQEINLNQGTKGVAREGDAVAIGIDLASWMTNVEAALSALGQVVAKLVGTKIGAISTASATVKAGG